jgi:hypothetical protein
MTSVRPLKFEDSEMAPSPTIEQPRSPRANVGSLQSRGLDQALNHFFAFLDRVRSWMTLNEPRLKKVYLVPEGSGLKLYVIPKSITHDFELTDSLCKFLIEMGDDGFDALGSQVPDGTPEELAAYFDPDKAFALSWR